MNTNRLSSGTIMAKMSHNNKKMNKNSLSSGTIMAKMSKEHILVYIVYIVSMLQTSRYRLVSETQDNADEFQSYFSPQARKATFLANRKSVTRYS